MNSEEKSKIEELKSSLYSRNAPDIKVRRHPRLHETQYDVEADWEHPKEDIEETKLNTHYEPRHTSFFTKLLIASMIFFVIALGIGTYLVLKGSDLVSANNIDISLVGPVSVAGGDPASFNVQVSNKNAVQMQVVDVTINFPTGSADPTDTTKALKTLEQVLPDISPGGIDQLPVNAVFFGEQNTQKVIQITVDYRVAGSNATFSKEKDFNILISSSPINLLVDSFTEVNSNQELDLDVTVASNSKNIIKNLLLSGQYPFGFTFTGATPAPLSDGKTWVIGDLPPGGKKEIHIKGTVQGQDGELRVFQFAVGVPGSGNGVGNSSNTGTFAANTIGTEYIATSQQVTIKKPFLSLALSLDGDSSTNDYIGSFDTPVQAEVSWLNNLPTSVIDGEIDLKLAGTVYDKASIDPQNGFFDSANDEIVWNTITTPALASIAAGDTGKVDFTFTPRNLGTPSQPLSDPQMTMTVSAKANRISQNNVPEEVDSSVVRNVKVSSNIALSGQITRSIGPFANTGPIPPVEEQTTTYTVIWTIYNTSSPVDNAQVTATLPAYAKFIGTAVPSTEHVTYDGTSGQVTWNIGNIAAYTGQNGSGTAGKRQVAFQVSIDPGANMVGQVPPVINQATLTAQDGFTGATLTSNVEALTTRFSTDPVFQDGDEMVGK